MKNRIIVLLTKQRGGRVLHYGIVWFDLSESQRLLEMHAREKKNGLKPTSGTSNFLCALSLHIKISTRKNLKISTSLRACGSKLRWLPELH